MTVITSCLVCQAAELERLMLVTEEGVAPQEFEHNFSYANTLLLVCQQCGSGILQKYSHDPSGNVEDDGWDMYWWYVLDLTDMQTIRQLLETCPTPQDPTCNCALHHLLRTSENVDGSIKHMTTPTSHADFARLTLAQDGDNSTLQLVHRDNII
ncbi:hypothetical protein [Dictyobacter kobayashii]|uniref:Uncharacterized protein n=1 Tax=Dictyobacter kobayashii TaxID=2014872 RepID=A0A402APU9_9CHLR|nr:hypothetical protein [Dictyobacter kobayashii]GCE21055.1 hypothetical protein KDK_48550 [Dictyobacter kobayashii]